MTVPPSTSHPPGAAQPDDAAARVRVDEILRALPEGEPFQLLREQVVAHSSVDPHQQWASSSSYLTYDKRTLTPRATAHAVDAALAAGQELQRAVSEGWRALVEALLRRDPPTAVRSLISLGETLERNHRRADARACYEKALELGASLTQSAPHLLALRRLGRLSQSHGELDRAYTLYQLAYNRALDSRDAMEAAAAATGLGNVKVDQGKWEPAEGHYVTARAHAEQAGDELQLGQLWNNLSVVRRRMGDLEGAAAFGARAIRQFERLGDSGELARCYNNLGLLQVEQREFERALESYGKAVALAESPYVVAAIHGNLCELHLRDGRWLLAEEQARAGEELALRHGFNLVLIHLYRLLGTLSRLREDANGVTFFEKALEVSRRYHYLHAQAEVHVEYGLFRRALCEEEEGEAHLLKALAIYRHLDARRDVQRVEGELRRPDREVGLGA
ncbi:MAG: tetratricopeptide repeat protein [Gemmatimonadota bacterium]